MFILKNGSDTAGWSSTFIAVWKQSTGATQMPNFSCLLSEVGVISVLSFYLSLSFSLSLFLFLFSSFYIFYEPMCDIPHINIVSPSKYSLGLNLVVRGPSKLA